MKCSRNHEFDEEKFWLGCPYCEGGAMYPYEMEQHAKEYVSRMDKLLEKSAVKRPSWDSIWMDFTQNLAKRSTCRRSSVGCVVVSDDHSAVLGLGYNGGPKGLNNDCISDEPGKCGHLHAEINALIKTNYRDASAKKAYITLTPCYNCAVALINAGIKEVIYLTEYRDPAGINLLIKAGIKVRRYVPEGVSSRDLYLNKDGT